MSNAIYIFPSAQQIQDGLDASGLIDPWLNERIVPFIVKGFANVELYEAGINLKWQMVMHDAWKEAEAPRQAIVAFDIYQDNLIAALKATAKIVNAP